jgi:polysaccharide transporter, PST family
VIPRLFRHVVVRNALLLYVVQFSTYLFPVITIPYLSRVLSTEKFGLIAFAQSLVWYFIVLTEYGFNLTATRAIAVHRDDPREVSRIFGAVMVAKLLLTIAGLILLLIAVLATPKLRPNLALFLIAFLAVIGNMLFPLWLYQGMEKMKHVAIRDLLAKLMGLLVLFAFVHSDRDYLIAAGAQSAALVLAGLLGLMGVPFLLKVPFRLPRPGDAWKELRAGWPVFLSLALSNLTLNANTVILGFRASTSEVAYFSAAQRIISALRSLVSPIVTSVYPHVSRKAAQSEQEVVQFVRKYALLLALPFLAIAVVSVFAAPIVIRIVLGRRYGPATLPLQILAFTPFFMAFSSAYSVYYMLACSYHKEWTRLMILAVAVNFVVVFPLLRFMRGSVALSITALVVEVFLTIMCRRFYQQRTRLTAAP